MKKTHLIKTEYLDIIFNNNSLIKAAELAVKKIKAFKKRHPFDAIAFTGTSGAGLAYILSLKLKIPLICVRKNKGHYSSKIEGCVSAKRYIIVDDFICSGNTIRRIIKTLKSSYETKEYGAKLVGIYLYNSYTRSLDFWTHDIPFIHTMFCEGCVTSGKRRSRSKDAKCLACLRQRV